MLKGTFVPKIFIDATDECPKLADMVKLCKEVDAYLCYAYLGDVGDSVTGDKKAQKFEDDYLDDVFECLKEEGVKAVTYMPTRNTPHSWSVCAICATHTECSRSPARILTRPVRASLSRQWRILCSKT